jgi:hypothetical protein
MLYSANIVLARAHCKGSPSYIILRRVVQDANEAQEDRIRYFSALPSLAKLHRCSPETRCLTPRLPVAVGGGASVWSLQLKSASDASWIEVIIAMLRLRKMLTGYPIARDAGYMMQGMGRRSAPAISCRKDLLHSHRHAAFELVTSE